MKPFDAYALWARVDKARGNCSLNDIAKSTGINYQRIKEQRSSNRIPSAEDMFKLSKVLNVSFEYLLTGESTESPLISPEARLVDQDEELKALVRAISHDRRLLSAISAVVRSYEVKVN